jgi:hypothetical protein
MSANLVYSNFVSTTLQTAITSSGQTTIVLASSTNLPTLTGGQQFVIVLNDAATQSVYEICYVQSITGSTLTVLRGQEGTAATTWLVGDRVLAPPTAGILNNFALINGSAAQNFSANGLTVASTSTFSGVITTAGVQDSGGTPAYTFLHGNVPLFGVASSNSAGINEIGFGQAVGVTFIGSGTANFSAVQGVSPTVLGMGSGALNSFAMDSNQAVGLGVVVAGVGTTNTLYATVGHSTVCYLAGSVAAATKALAFGNALGVGNYTTLGSMGDAVGTSGISGTFFEIDSTGTPAMGMNNLANMGIAGTSYNNSSSRTLKKNIQPLHFNPLETLRGFKAQSWHVNEQDDAEPLQFGPIAEDLPDQIRSGKGGYNNTAAVSLALECLRIVEERVTTLEGKAPAAVR